MANINISDTTANAQASALSPLANSGLIELYTGTQPANANTALSGNVLLATLTFGNPAFGAPASGILTANAIESGTAVASGTATFARIYKSDGTTVLWDATVGTSGAAINMGTTEIVVGGTVSISSATYTVPEVAS